MADRPDQEITSEHMDVNRPMTLDEWVADTKAGIERFAAAYRKDAAAAREDQSWPMIQPPGEWDDQYRGFSE